MANVQKQFEAFHETIRTDYEMDEELREKRDIILEKVNNHLRSEDLPGFDRLLQGSYAMRTGVKPLSGQEYDIDVGLHFSISVEDYGPSDVRGWLMDAVGDHTFDVEAKPSCIRVNYITEQYHVDLVSYADWNDPTVDGEVGLAHRDNGWKPADPRRLMEHVDSVRETYEGTEDGRTKTDQFRRCTRYIRRWDDVAMPEEGDDKPSGLAWLLLAAEHLVPTTDSVTGKPRDLEALRRLATRVALVQGRIEIRKPIPEYEDLFGELSDDAMAELKERFAELTKVLRKAQESADPVDACETLEEEFGEDFPVPDRDETGQSTEAAAVVPGSASA